MTGAREKCWDEKWKTGPSSLTMMEMGKELEGMTNTNMKTRRMDEEPELIPTPLGTNSINRWLEDPVD